MIKAVREAVSVPYIVAGGITNEELLRQTLKAGADIVQIGTVIEQSDNAMKKTELFAKVIKEEGSKKLKVKELKS